MRKSISLLVLAAVAQSAAAQSSLAMPASFAPEQNELGGFRSVPLMRANARLQQFFDATEAGSSTFVATGVELRYDGPIPNVGAPGPFTIERLKISVGTAAAGTPGPVFAANYQSPPTVVFNRSVTYWPDQGSVFAEPWGGLNGGLRFAFNSPVAVAIPSGGWLVVEIAMSGNSMNAQAHGMLDFEAGFGGPFDGSASSSGTGCSAAPGALLASISTSGVHAPGAVHYLTGQNLGAGAPVVAVLGASATQSALGSLPWAVPGTGCAVYTSWEVFLNTTANALGSTTPNDPALAVALSADPALSFATYHAQLISLVPDANSPWSLVFSDKRTVQLGGLNPLGMGMYVVSNGDSASHPFADTVGEGGYAMRFLTQ